MSFPVHPWKVVERGWQPNTQRFAESLMSLANGYMGLRGNFEEDYSGDSFQGTYLGGVWYPDKTRVGWWKKGYPEYYAKVINTINLIGIHVIIDQHPLDLSRATVWEYEREVDMRTAVLYRHACVDMDKGSLTLDTWRFVSLDTKELLAIRYQVTPSFDCRMEVSPYLDGNVRNVDANYDQSFWNMVDGEGWDERGGVLVQTKPNPYGVQRFTVAAAMTNRVEGRRCKKIFRYCMLFGVVFTEILSAVFMIWDDFFVSIYTTSSAVAAFAISRMRHVCSLEGLTATYEVNPGKSCANSL